MKAWTLKPRAGSRPRPPTNGRAFEDQAMAFLQSHGLDLVERNFCCRCGEIDLVMLDSKTLVFVEVKYRRNSQHGEAVEQVTASKRRKLVNSALVFLSCKSQYSSYPCRFDVVAISSRAGSDNIHWVANAFDLS